MSTIAPPDSAQWVKAVGERGYQLILDIYDRLGGAADRITAIEIGEVYETGTIDTRVAVLEKEVEQLKIELEMKADYSSHLSILENKIINLEISLSMLPSFVEVKQLRNDLHNLGIEMDMNYGS